MRAASDLNGPSSPGERGERRIRLMLLTTKERLWGVRGGEIEAATMERDQEMKRKAENVAKRLGMFDFRGRSGERLDGV